MEEAAEKGKDQQDNQQNYASFSQIQNEQKKLQMIVDL